LFLAVRSFRYPSRSFTLAATLLVAVITVSALTDASPVTEGAPVKAVF
jgi:hypothetical protein